MYSENENKPRLIQLYRLLKYFRKMNHLPSQDLLRAAWPTAFTDGHFASALSTVIALIAVACASV